MSNQKFTAEDVRGVLLAVGYTLEEVVEFMADSREWYPAWEAFFKYTEAKRLKGERLGGMAIINLLRHYTELKKIKDFKLNNNWQPKFCAMYNGKTETSYFEMRTKHNKSKHYQREAA